MTKPRNQRPEEFAATVKRRVALDRALSNVESVENHRLALTNRGRLTGTVEVSAEAVDDVRRVLAEQGVGLAVVEGRPLADGTYPTDAVTAALADRTA